MFPLTTLTTAALLTRMFLAPALLFPETVSVPEPKVLTSSLIVTVRSALRAMLPPVLATPEFRLIVRSLVEPVADSVMLPDALTSLLTMIEPVEVATTWPLVAMMPLTSGRQAPAVIVPIVKPPTSVNSMFPSVVESAANVPVIWLLALSRSMLFRARTPRFTAVMRPFAS